MKCQGCKEEIPEDSNYLTVKYHNTPQIKEDPSFHSWDCILKFLHIRNRKNGDYPDLEDGDYPDSGDNDYNDHTDRLFTLATESTEEDD